MDSDWCQGFPHDAVLVKLLEVSNLNSTPEPIIYDAYGLEKTYAELLGDILETRDRIRRAVSTSSLDDRGFFLEAAPYTGYLGLSGYEFVVAFFATRALAGACMPFGSRILPREAHSFLVSSKACVLLVGKHRVDEGQRIKEYSQRHDHNFQVALISSDAPPAAANSITVDNSVLLDDGGPGFVIFTSGTTGPPKGAVLPRRCLSYQGAATPGSATICDRPPHWIGGAYPLLESTLIGRPYKVDHMAFTPGMFRRMKQDYHDRICNLPQDEQRQYIEGIRNLKTAWQAGGMPSESMLEFWRTMIGKPIVMKYGSTELGGLVTEHDGLSTIKYSVGKPYEHVDLKLSDGDSGTIFVRCPQMMTHYIGSEDATRKAFDSEGYLDSGDLGHFQNGELVYDGRASNEYIFFDGYRIPILSLEHALEDLPYVSEGHIVAVPDHESNELCGVLARVQNTDDGEKVNLARIRADLSKDHPTYKLPVLLRILRDDEDVPATVSSKTMKRQAAKKFFLKDDYWSVESPTPGVEYWSEPEDEEHTGKTWDWAGLQR
ncbi:hypothetical protein ED733_006343 [Metarhizium rileyi]|uniref:AMP-dependent synthetase/ligase domain-containing protein n=1 Tax=Metarhizium rileyi (strain RCEF 4871) TaxID=1649241 RepID=A0A5C6GDC6_METRR|nr:hypothetical protein ED733_006343 [Metarhizium rileyi]